MSRKTGYVFDDLFLRHTLGAEHPEAPVRLEAINLLLETTGLLHGLSPVTPTISDEIALQNIRRIHSGDHISSVKQAGFTWKAALQAVKGVIQAADGIMEGRLDNAFCGVRPPGHHSHNNGAHYDGRNQGEGFCFFNNVAIAARYIQSHKGMENILIIDWDYHHGNGTEWSFYSDPTVFFFSTHILWGYPGSGFPDHKGEGKGEGYTLNIPLPDGAGDREILAVWNEQFIPYMEHIGFSPDFILVSAGFDSREEDYLGTFQITDEGFSQLTAIALGLAEKYCRGRLLSVLEGGYNPKGLASAVHAHLKALLG